MFRSSTILFLTLTLLAFRLSSAASDLLEGLQASDTSTSDGDSSETRLGEQTPEEKFRVALSRTPGRRLHKLPDKGNNREEIEALRQVFQSSPHFDWSIYKAKPVTEPNCYIEVQVPQRVPGRCTKLGGQIPACQSQDLLTIDYTSCGGV